MSYSREVLWVRYVHRDKDSRRELCPGDGGSCLLLWLLSLWCRCWDTFRIWEQMIDWSLRSQAEKVDDTEFEGKMKSFSLTHQYSLSHFIIFLRVLGIIWNFVFPFLTDIFFSLRSETLHTLFTPASADRLLALLCICGLN